MNKSPSPAVSWPAGLLAGAIATLPMTLVMLWIRDRLPGREQTALPPMQVVDRVSEAVSPTPGIRRRLRQDLPKGVAHVGFGAIAGALFAGLLPDSSNQRVQNGVLFGLFVWLFSYQGWLPALHLYPAIKDETPGRNAMMGASHVVWGGLTAGLLQAISRQK